MARVQGHPCGNWKGSTRRTAPGLLKVWKGSAFFRMFQRVAVLSRCTHIYLQAPIPSPVTHSREGGGLETGEVQPHPAPERRAFPTWVLTARGAMRRRQDFCYSVEGSR